MDMGCLAPKAIQGQMLAMAIGQQMAKRGEQFCSTSVEGLLNRVPVGKNLVNPYINRLVR